MRRDVAIEFLMRQIGRVESTARRPRRGPHERRVIVDQVKAAAVDSQKPAQRNVFRRAACRRAIDKASSLRDRFAASKWIPDPGTPRPACRPSAVPARSDARSQTASHRLEFRELCHQVRRDDKILRGRLRFGACLRRSGCPAPSSKILPSKKESNASIRRTPNRPGDKNGWSGETQAAACPGF